MYKCIGLLKYIVETSDFLYKKGKIGDQVTGKEKSKPK